jgi:hypothetical protein
MLAAFLLLLAPGAALAQVSVTAHDYDAECSVVLEEVLSSEALFTGWWIGSGGTRGLGDGAFTWIVEGWEDYGYQQAISPWSASGSVRGWGWAAVSEGGSEAPELRQLTMSCLSGGTAAMGGAEDPFGIGLTIIASAADGVAETWSADRARYSDGTLEVSCGAAGWEEGVELTVTVSWLSEGEA